LRVEEPSEALEVCFEPVALASAAESLDAGVEHFVVDATAVNDLTVWSICSQLRTALLSVHPPDALEMDQWLHLLAEHSLVTCGGLCFPNRGTGRLSAKRLARVGEFIDAELHRPIRLNRTGRSCVSDRFSFRSLVSEQHRLAAASFRCRASNAKSTPDAAGVARVH
jgi:hypothetical protein